ncbi:hypothetical protein [Nevskia sp.]|uniref:hypothetical protein n=1 Tax=Nevskia sp. TaxID=1929292 RepID=UPI0025E95023|nr:hypothetical protein [Nevskia sp.]
MTLESLMQLVSDAWRVAADAFAAAELLPLFAVWGLGFGAAEGLAWLDDRRDAADHESSPTSAPLKA